MSFRRAKLLRNSSDEVIRTSVYINADFTPAERKSSYDQRCLRRQRAATRSTSGSKSASTAVTNRPPTAPTHTSAESSSGVDDHQHVVQLGMSFASAVLPAAMSTAILSEAILNHSLIQTSSKPCTPPEALLMTSSAVISQPVIEQTNLSTSPMDLSSSGSRLLSTNKLCQSSTSTAINQPSTMREKHLLQPTTTQPVVTDSS